MTNLIYKFYDTWHQSTESTVLRHSMQTVVVNVSATRLAPMLARLPQHQ